MRMAGILGEVIEDKDLIIKKIDELIEEPNIGIIILTQKTKMLIADDMMKKPINSKSRW
jgi:vacuolar-type H+-ATPase subunit F/Vma7